MKGSKEEVVNNCTKYSEKTLTHKIMQINFTTENEGITCNSCACVQKSKLNRPNEFDVVFLKLMKRRSKIYTK